MTIDNVRDVFFAIGVYNTSESENYHWTNRYQQVFVVSHGSSLRFD